MKLPKMNVQRLNTTAVNQFGGYNHTLSCGIAEGFDMLNMSSDAYPSLAPREKRCVLYSDTSQITGMVSGDYVYFTDLYNLHRMGADGNIQKITIDRESESDEIINESGAFSQAHTERRLIKMGAYIVIFPEKIRINTEEIYGDSNLRAPYTPLEVTSNSVKIDASNNITGNGIVVALSRSGAGDQNSFSRYTESLSHDGLSSFLQAATVAKESDGDTYGNAEYIFKNLLSGEARKPNVDYYWINDSVNNLRFCANSSYPFGGYWVIDSDKYGETLALDGLCVCDASSIPPTLHTLVRQTVNGETAYVWRKTEDPLVRITSNDSITDPVGNNMTGEANSVRRSLYYKNLTIGDTQTDPARAGNGIGHGFAKGDSVTITRNTLKKKNGQIIRTEINDGEVFGNRYTLEEVGEDHISFSSSLSTGAWSYRCLTGSETETYMIYEIIVKKELPKLDFVCELNNRLYGCSSDSHEVYASKLGDASNWYTYSGISTDSYAATVGTSGEFTGCIGYDDTVLFFKENCIHRLYGSQPSNFQITTYDCVGLQKGSEKSLKIINGILYYLSPRGMMAYDGSSYPIPLYAPFGDKRYHAGVAGTKDDKYYLSVLDENDRPHVFVYDTAKKLWHKEDSARLSEFAEFGGELIGAAGNSLISLTDGKKIAFNAESAEETVEWSFETGELGTDSISCDNVVRLMLRVVCEKGTVVRVKLQCDGGEWRHIYSLTANAHRTYSIPIIPQRCDRMKCRISGKGKAKILSIGIVRSEGSDVIG